MRRVHRMASALVRSGAGAWSRRRRGRARLDGRGASLEALEARLVLAGGGSTTLLSAIDGPLNDLSAQVDQLAGSSRYSQYIQDRITEDRYDFEGKANALIARHDAGGSDASLAAVEQQDASYVREMLGNLRSQATILLGLPTSGVPQGVADQVGAAIDDASAAITSAFLTPFGTGGNSGQVGGEGGRGGSIQVPLQYDFGTADSPVAAAYTRVTADTTYSAGQGYGWTSGTIYARDRYWNTDLIRDDNLTHDGTFAVDLPNGTYKVTPTIGDLAPYSWNQVQLYLEGNLADTYNLGQFSSVQDTYTVHVRGGQLTVRLNDPLPTDIAPIQALSIQMVSLDASPQDVLTYHDDQYRTGSNPNETTLTPQNVGSSDFGKLFSVKVDGEVYAQPLYMTNLTMPDGSTHDVVFVATEMDKVYAIDANDPTAGPNGNGVLWMRDYTNPTDGLVPVPSAELNIKPISPTIGITGTPVIDPTTGTMYFVTDLKQQTGGRFTKTGTYRMQLHAVDIATGQERPGSPSLVGETTIHGDGTYTVNTPLTAQGTGSAHNGTTVPFTSFSMLQRPGLVLDTNVPGHDGPVVFASFGPTHDAEPYHGWMAGWDAKSLGLYTTFNDTPDGYGGSLWQSGVAPTVLPNGDLMITGGNVFVGASGELDVYGLKSRYNDAAIEGLMG